MQYTNEELKAILDKHAAWLRGEEGGERANLWGANLAAANLRGANLSGADLSGADLTEANLTEADLTEANLHGAKLRGADLRGVDLSGADLRGVNLSRANLRGADLYRADLTGADLRGADLRRANLYGAKLRGADLRGANLVWQICPEVGSFVGFKKVRTAVGQDVVLRVRIDSDVPRVNGIGSRKCRAERVYVLGVESGPKADYYLPKTQDCTDCRYVVGEYIVADDYVDDPRLECTGGIYFFMTRKEAEEW